MTQEASAISSDQATSPYACLEVAKVSIMD